ncbi:MAG: dihydroorotate dehydrogenase [Eubacteriaceae bacterium]|nr:dihydroorotate dehydrogenase [Eubacteriaceae bacterium]
MDRLKLDFLGVEMKNPIIAASGTFGYGDDYRDFFDPSILGGVSSKGITFNAKDGNSGIRVYETPAGLLNSIGLQNPGIAGFITDYLPNMRKLGCALIVNLGGDTMEQYIGALEMLEGQEFDILELNISCPNVKSGGMAFGMKAEDVFQIVSESKKNSSHKMMVKLTPNAFNLVDTAIAAQEAGADAVSLVNTFSAMAIDVNNKKAVFDNVYAGLSGPAIMPIALRMVHQVSKALDIPVCGMGGISSAEDAIAFMMAGARCVQVGSIIFRDPNAPVKMIEGLRLFCEQEGLTSLSDIVGII